MTRPVYIAADNILSPLGNSSAENFEKVKSGESAIRRISNAKLSQQPFFASMFPDTFFEARKKEYTRFEKLCLDSISEALSHTSLKFSDPGIIFILSTTKGNIELIENRTMDEQIRKRVSLFDTANLIAKAFKAANQPLVVSHACISGVLSILIAKRLLQTGKFRHAVITGADVLSKFIISGFQSLHAMSEQPCKPFDVQRNGINLGECAATVILTTEPALVNKEKKIVIKGGASTNDANHISGPSRTGLELSHAIKSAMKEDGLTGADLSFISAHGTATSYNDEMESKAFSNASLLEVPLHSLKGNFGHTLGAAGVLESVLTCHSLLDEIVLPSKNFETLGVSEKVTVSRGLAKSKKVHALKTASGFGGSNAAIIYSIQ